MNKSIVSALNLIKSMWASEPGVSNVTATLGDDGVITVNALVQAPPVSYINMTLQIDDEQTLARRELKFEVLASCLIDPWHPVRALSAVRAFRASCPPLHPSANGPGPIKVGEKVISEALALRDAISFVRYCHEQWGELPAPLFRALRK